MTQYRLNLTLEELDLLDAIVTESAKQYSDLRIQMLYRAIHAKKTIAQNLEKAKK